MAQKVMVSLTDDLDGKPLDGKPGAGTVTFGLDGQRYEIDLSAKHAKEFRATVQPYAEKARKVRPAASSSRTGNGYRPPAERQRTRDIRAWAVKNGVIFSDRGRIPGHVVAQYESAHGT